MNTIKTMTSIIAICVIFASNSQNVFAQGAKNLAPEISVQVPNVFTPNGDGTNDFFRIEELKDNQHPDNELIVINQKSNEVVFRTTNYQNDWDGIAQKSGNTLPEGTYFYMLVLDRKNRTAKNNILRGFIEIVR